MISDTAAPHARSVGDAERAPVQLYPLQDERPGNVGRSTADELRELALQHKPKIIPPGFTPTRVELDYAKFAEIAKEVGPECMLAADMAHCRPDRGWCRQKSV